MISFWVTQAGSIGIKTYCEHRGRAIADRFQTRIYDGLPPVVRLGAGPQVFAALDQLTDSQREVVVQLWDAHARIAPAACRLNDPRRVLLRFPLLTRLHDEGINAFRVFRASASEDVTRFPVFVRQANNHAGPLTGLLHTPRDIGGALHALRLRGHRLRDLMIEEFCDTSGPDGLFRKYAAFKVGDSIIPCHMMASRRWCVKSVANEPDEATIHEGMEYVEDNPHRDWLRRVFDVAGTGYGRVDYGVLDGVPQVWEVNLNPTIGRGAGAQRHASLDPDLGRLREEGREVFHSRLRAAFVSLDGGNDDTDVSVTIGKPLLTRLRAEAAASERRRRIVSFLQSLYDHPRLGMPARAVYGRLFPRR